MLYQRPCDGRLDRHSLTKRGTVAIALCSLIQISQAIVALRWPTGAKATSILGEVNIFHLLDSPDGAHVVAASMIFFSLLGLYGAVAYIGWPRALMFVGQQLLLGFQAWGGIQAIWAHSYLDGTLMDRPHIYNDQIAWAGLFFIHLWCVYCRCKERG